jgi:hypothetical protein
MCQPYHLPINLRCYVGTYHYTNSLTARSWNIFTIDLPLRLRQYTWVYNYHQHKYLLVFGRFAKLRKVNISFRSYVCAALKKSAVTGRNFVKFGISKFVEKIQVSLKSEKNNRYFTLWPTYIYDNISLNSSYNEKRFKKFVEKSKHPFYV